MTTTQSASQPTTATVAQQMISSLPENHVIHTLVQEHFHFLGILRMLMKARAQLLECEALENAQEPWKDIRHFVQVLINADSHHQREETSLFPMVKEMGGDAMQTEMIREHDHLRAMKKNLIRLTSAELEARSFNNQKMIIVTSCERFVGNLFAHIQKENITIFPLALDVIKDAQIWEKMRIECDNIGYGPELIG